MKRVLMPVVFACAACLQAATPAVAQDWRHITPSAAQESPQTVRAAIPPQAPRPSTPSGRSVDQPYQPSASSQSFEDVPNVRVEVTISYQVGQGPAVKRSASLVVAGSQDSGSLRSGNQVPVPSTSFIPFAPSAKSEGTAAAPGGGSPVTSFSYRSVGLNLDARRVRISGNKAKMDLNVEFSAIDEKTADPGRASGPSYPSFPTFSQNLSVVLDSGKPVVIAQTSDVVDNVVRKQSVEVTATILR